MRTAAEQRAWEAHASGLPAKLLRILEQHTNAAGLAYAAAPAPLGGGYWASLYRFRLAQAPGELTGELVLRVMPTSDEQCLREAAIQAAVSAAGFPAPRVHLSGGRDAGLGFPFMIMAHVAGTTPATGFALPRVLGETMAELHALDETPVAQALARAGVEAAGVRTVLADLAERIAAPGGDGFAGGLAWLRSREPPPGACAICHGDFHPRNLLMDDGKVSGLIDWTQAVLADPAFDVAYTSQLLALWPLESAFVPRPLGRLLGRLAGRRFLHAYERRSLAALPHISWYEALHGLRLLARVARARSGITLPPLPHDHPWELVAEDAARAFYGHTGVRIELPPRCEPRAAS